MACDNLCWYGWYVGAFWHENGTARVGKIIRAGEGRTGRATRVVMGRGRYDGKQSGMLLGKVIPKFNIGIAIFVLYLKT